MNDIVQRPKYEKGWVGGLPETPCGSGSTLANTVEQREWIADLLHRYDDINTIADIGAGDLNWFKQMTLPPRVFYQAFDLVPRHTEVKQFDIISDPMPKADMYWLLWVLNHFPKEQAALAWNRVQESGVKYVLITDRPIWYEDHPECLRDLPYMERLILNRKEDQILLVEL